MAGVAASGIGLSAYAFGPAASTIVLSRLDAVVPGLPASLEGLRVAHVTDVHLPANHAAARHTLELLAAERPDIVVMTGDLLERRSGMDELVAFAREARGSLATYATMGNWEWSAGIDPGTARRGYERAGVEFLCNESAVLTVRGSRISVVGLDDWVMGRPDPRAALQAYRDSDATIWALHAPGYADLLPPEAPASLLLSGHTHGGQIRLPLVPAWTPRGSGRFLAGWYDTPAAPLYVSRGIGTTDIRARFRCPAELPIFTLRRGGHPAG